MSTSFLHERLSVTASWFILALAIWALWLFIRNRPIDGSWLGAAIIAELLLIAQSLLGGWMYLGQGLGVTLDRGWLHILYGAIVLVIFPASWGYFSNIKDDRVQTLAMVATCFFWWGIAARLGQTGV